MEIKAKSIFVMGDMHGEAEYFNAILNAYEQEGKRPEVVIILGDVGLFWEDIEQQYHPAIRTWETTGVQYTSDKAFRQIDTSKTKVFWFVGNHEQHNHIEMLYGRNGQEPIEIKPNLFYCPIGSTLTINGKECLFAGGALSIDKQYRTKDVSWFEQEELDDSDFQYMSSYWKEKDIYALFSHTCATGYNILAPHDRRGLKFNDNTCHVLKNIVDLYKPEFHFFGHWHRTKQGYYRSTTWQAVNTISEGWEEGGRSVIDISYIFPME